ncbi:hypothetical protein N7471_007224 [Penicillium samsonianum]|uniref:uncharacterized protein n=1 Tax=Penicillium samsonianum TaxID=1882272 RepID=UPI002547D83E|nr:uncharacterized protein N7471_007224 [Penicillium samsonianum]KAJ6132009.1 hypothetical protein N7471_007224 [Penicillium samsonianum]
MSSTITQTITQREPVSTEVENDDFLKNKIIEHFSQLTVDSDFQKASATYSKVKEQQEQIRIRDEKLVKLQKDIKPQEENEVLAFSKLSAVNQPLTTQKENTERQNASLRKEVTERDKSLTEISRRIQELQSQRSQDERKMSSLVAQHNLDIGSLQRKFKERDGAINKMRATHANLTSLLAVEQTKSDCLEKEKKSLDETMRKARSRLEKLDVFILT